MNFKKIEILKLIEVRIEGHKPKLNIQNLKCMLEGCDDHDLQDCLLAGVTHGFDTGINNLLDKNYRVQEFFVI